jgi:hypothetical protein
MRELLYIFIVVLISFYNISATAQYPDLIILNGDTLSLYSNPLEKYFDLYPEKRPENEIVSTALWRGYVATFEIKNDLFLLKDIQIEVEKGHLKFEWKSVLQEVFPGMEEIIVDWFTGLLVIPKGELVNYVHMGYASEYDSYTLFQIKEGILEKEKNFTHEEYVRFKKRQFEEFKKTDEYKKLYDEMLEDQEDPVEIEHFLYIFVIDYSTKFLVDL